MCLSEPLEPRCLHLPAHPHPRVLASITSVVADLCLCCRAVNHRLWTHHTACGRRCFHTAVQSDWRPQCPPGELLDEERGGDPGNTHPKQEHRVQVGVTAKPFVCVCVCERVLNMVFSSLMCLHARCVSTLQAEQTKRRRRRSVHVRLHLRTGSSGQRHHRS